MVAVRVVRCRCVFYSMYICKCRACQLCCMTVMMFSAAIIMIPVPVYSLNVPLPRPTVVSSITRGS